MNLNELIKTKRRRRRGADGPTSYRQIAAELNFERIPTANGGIWYPETVRRFIAAAEREEAVKRQVRKDQLALDDFLTAGQVRAAARALEGHLWMLFLFMVGTGLRRAEVAAVRVRDIDCGKRLVTVRRGKRWRLRSVIIGTHLAGILAGYMRANCAGRRSAVFADGQGRALSPRQITYRVEKMRKLTGIDWLHPHVLRHTFGTLLYNYKKDIIFVQNQMGHRKLETTGIYARSYVESGYEQMDGVDAMMGLKNDVKNTRKLHKSG